MVRSTFISELTVGKTGCSVMLGGSGASALVTRPPNLTRQERFGRYSSPGGRIVWTL